MPAATSKKIVGLKYEHGEGLPQLILKGQGILAEEILRKRQFGNAIPVVKDKELLEKLYRLPIDSEISPDLFKIVAVMLAHVFAIDRQQKNEEQA